MNELSDAVWADILAHVRTHQPAVARGWFGQLQPGMIAHGQLTILVSNWAQFAHLREHCTRAFVEAAQAVTGYLVAVEFALKGAEYAGQDAPSSITASVSSSAPSWAMETSVPQLNADYTFDGFVVGPCNRLAHASSVAVGEKPGAVYNPLFIHGRAGLGKTHLLQAICRRVLDRSPASRITYLSCETFVNHFIEAVERGALNDFRYRYRHADVLVLDDIQFLAARERSQEEFFHTFNTLYQLRKQIVLSADCSPSDIPTLEERLVSRFSWGLVARIEPPCLETRMAIIRKKAKIRGLEVPEDVTLFLASRVTTNTRELEGALTRLRGMAALDGDQPIDLALAHRTLGAGSDDPPKLIRIQDIMSAVTECFGIKLSDLQGRRRSRCIALPRQVCMYLARELTEHSLGEIGGFFGGRDHTTVLHAYRLVEQRRAEDPAFRSRLDEIEAGLRSN
jgi:chromosomal replication initiator protein